MVRAAESCKKRSTSTTAVTKPFLSRPSCVVCKEYSCVLGNRVADRNKETVWPTVTRKPCGRP